MYLTSGVREDHEDVELGFLYYTGLARQCFEWKEIICGSEPKH
jgi:hypothetical protein